LHTSKHEILIASAWIRFNMSLAVDCIGHLSADINVLGHVKGMNRSRMCSNNTQILLLWSKFDS